MDYEHRVRVSVRRGPDRYEALEEIAGVCEMSVSHFCDILAVPEGGEWLVEVMKRRVEEGLRRVRNGDGRCPRWMLRRPIGGRICLFGRRIVSFVGVSMGEGRDYDVSNQVLREPS